MTSSPQTVASHGNQNVLQKFLGKQYSLPNALSRMYHRAMVAVLLCREYRVRKRAHQSVKKLLSSLGSSSLAHGLLGELHFIINKHKVRVLYLAEGKVILLMRLLPSCLTYLIFFVIVHLSILGFAPRGSSD